VHESNTVGVDTYRVHVGGGRSASASHTPAPYRANAASTCNTHTHRHGDGHHSAVQVWARIMRRRPAAHATRRRRAVDGTCDSLSGFTARYRRRSASVCAASDTPANRAAETSTFVARCVAAGAAAAGTAVGTDGVGIGGKRTGTGAAAGAASAAAAAADPGRGAYCIHTSISQSQSVRVSQTAAAWQRTESLRPQALTLAMSTVGYRFASSSHTSAP
jgi:hypothetical protein